MGEFDISLIEEFRQRESLYDRNSLQFKDKLYNAQQWQEISNKLGYDVSILKDRMLQLRNRYNLEKRRMEQLREETGKHHESPWGLYDSLQFLSGHIKSRRRYKSILPVYNHKDDSQLNDSGNDYSAMGVDDSAMLIDNSAKDDMMHSPGGVGGSSSQPFPNGLFSVKVEENMSEGHASEVDTENSQSTRGNDHFADNLNVMTEIHSSNDQYREQMRRLQNQQMQMQQQQQQQQQEKHHQEQQQQQHENRQQQLQQHNSHQQILPTRIIKRSLGHNNPMISVRSDMTHPKLRKLSRPPQMATPTIGKRVYEDDCGHMVGSAYNNFPKQMRLSPRENKYNAFGNFISSSLLDLPQKMALELVEKFTSDIVKALTAKMENMEAAAAAKAAAAAPTTVDLDDDNEENNHHHQQHHHHNHQQQQQRQEMQNEDSNDE